MSPLYLLLLLISVYTYVVRPSFCLFKTDRYSLATSTFACSAISQVSAAPAVPAIAMSNSKFSLGDSAGIFKVEFSTACKRFPFGPLAFSCSGSMPPRTPQLLLSLTPFASELLLYIYIYMHICLLFIFFSDHAPRS